MDIEKLKGGRECNGTEVSYRRLRPDSLAHCFRVAGPLTEPSIMRWSGGGALRPDSLSHCFRVAGPLAEPSVS